MNKGTLEINGMASAGYNPGDNSFLFETPDGSKVSIGLEILYYALDIYCNENKITNLEQLKSKLKKDCTV